MTTKKKFNPQQKQANQVPDPYIQKIKIKQQQIFPKNSNNTTTACEKLFFIHN